MDGIFFKASSQKVFRLLVLLLFLMSCVFPGIDTTSTPPSPQFTDHILVSLTEPENGESYPISAGLSVRAEAISDGSIARMELWADGNLYETYAAPEDGLGLLVHDWTWSPGTTGSHTLMVRAYNDLNQTAVSNVIHIEGIPDPGYFLLTTVEEGDTILSIANRYNVTVEDILRENPSLAGATSLPVGTEIVIHISPKVTSSTPTTTAKVLMKLNEWSASRTHSKFIPSAALTAPVLSISGQGCAAMLSINDFSEDEKGFNLYRLSPGMMSFSKLTTLPANKGKGVFSYQDPNLYGLYHYYAAAFDETGEAAGNLVSLNITDASCAGEPTAIDDLAFIPMSVENYYLYVAINNGPWRRFPADEFTFLKTSQNMDFGQVAASLAPNLVGNFSMRGEVWGMVNGTATLLGTFDKSFKTGQAPAKFDPSGFYNSITTKLEVRGVYDPSKDSYPWLVSKGMAYDSQIFRFGTDTDAAYGMWQVSSVPFQAEVSFNPACLLLAGKANGSGTPVSPFQFNIDFSTLKPKIESVQLSPFENSLDQTPVFSSPFSPEKMDTSAQQTVMEPKWGAGAFDLGGSTPVFVNFDPCAQNVSPEGVVTYYVRIIPMNNGQAAGKPSNTVTMNYDPNAEIKITFPAPPPVPIWTYYDVEILKFTGVHVPNLQYAYCVVIVKNDNPLYPYKPGDILCPEKDQGGNKNFLEQLGDAVESAFNYFSGLYNKLSDWATELVEQLNPLCIQAKMASSALKVGEKEVKDACHYVAVIAVTAAKTYVGLPPSLPNFDQLTELGKENLVELAAQELEKNGVPCPEECKDVIRKGVDLSIEQVQKSMSNSACTSEAEEHGYKKLCLPPGVISKPDPRGQPAPAVAEVKVTRRENTTGPDFPEPTSCNASINVSAINISHVGKSYSFEAGYSWKGTGIEGDLLSGVEAFPNLQPGKSTKIPIVLKPAQYWLPDHYQFARLARLKTGIPTHFDDWGVLYEGALATLQAGGTCKFDFPEGTGISSVAVKGNSIQAGPLGGAWLETCHKYGNCP